MSVIYRNTLSGGAGNAKVFTDNFQRANANDWGGNWMQRFSGSSDGSAYSAFKIVGNAGRGYQINAGAGDGDAFPVPLMWIPNKGGQFSQFCEGTTSATSVASGGFNLHVCTPLAWANIGLFFFGIYCNVNGTHFLNRYQQNPAANLSAPSTQAVLVNLGAWSLGDLLRIEAVFNSGTGFWTLTAKKNGVQTGTFSDNNSGIAGMPSLHCGMANAGGTTDLSHFSAGLL